MTGRGDGTLKLRRNGSCLAPALSGAKWLHLRCESDVGVVEFCPIPERSWEIPETAYLPCFNKGTAFRHCKTIIADLYLYFNSQSTVIKT